MGEDTWDEAVDRAAQAGATLVAVAGGDGSLRLAATAVMRHGLTLGIIPTGTGNALARELGIPLDPNAAWLALGKPGTATPLDVGTVNGQAFLTVATVGITSGIAKEVSRLPKASFGTAVYIPALVRAFGKSTPFSLRVEAGGKVFEGAAHQCVVGVGSKQGALMALHPEASRTDGLLNVYVVEAAGYSSLRAYAAGLAGQALGLTNPLWTASATDISVEVKRSRTFVLDGDRFKWESARASVVAGGLKVWLA